MRNPALLRRLRIRSKLAGSDLVRYAQIVAKLLGWPNDRLGDAGLGGLLHDVGNYVNIRGHHKHSQYLIAASEIFGLSQDEMLLVSNVARYHRRALPSKSHLPYMALDREARVAVNKLSALLRLANALDADHLQKIKDVHVLPEDDAWVLEVEGAGDLTMERLASLARADYLTEVFGRKVTFREARQRPWP